MKQTILLIEDNPYIMKINRTALTRRGYRVVEAETLEKGRALLNQENPHLLILDIMMPDENGLTFCEEVRKKSNLPILFLSVLNENQDIVNGLMHGGDDYLPKPYNLDVLLARVDALLRRAGCANVLTKGVLTLNTVSQCALVKGKDILLTPKEFAILLYLVQNEGREIQMEQLYEETWGKTMGNDTYAVKTTVSRLRKKIESSGFTIVFVRGAGYRFEKL